MNTLPLPRGCSYVSGSFVNVKSDFLGGDPQRNKVGLGGGILFNPNGPRNGDAFAVSAKIRRRRRHDYPWPRKVDPEWKSSNLLYLSKFKPQTEKPKPVVLGFEKPLVEIEKKIENVRRMAEDTGLDFTEQIKSLESNYDKAKRKIYGKLSPYQKLTIARHPNRPTFLDHIFNITDKWLELHGDRAGYDDPAIVCGLGSIDGKTCMFIGHQKGRNTKENIERNFGMPTPHGYRKALRLMQYADRKRFPIVTFVDTPGAFADLKSEELNQGEAIARNLRDMFGFSVPIISIVIGEGGSGGALAIACGNYIFMLENAVFYVASPEACAAILWKTARAAPKAARRLKITSVELYRQEICDGVIPEPLGGAHCDPKWTSQQIKNKILHALKELEAMDNETLMEHRYKKFRKIGGYGFQKLEPIKKRSLFPAVKQLVTERPERVVKDNSITKKDMIVARKALKSNKLLSRLRLVFDMAFAKTLLSMHLYGAIRDIRMKFAESNTNPNGDALAEELQQVMDVFNQKLLQHGKHLKFKRVMLLLWTVVSIRQRIMGNVIMEPVEKKEIGADGATVPPVELKLKRSEAGNVIFVARLKDEDGMVVEIPLTLGVKGDQSNSNGGTTSRNEMTGNGAPVQAEGEDDDDGEADMLFQELEGDDGDDDEEDVAEAAAHEVSVRDTN